MTDDFHIGVGLVQQRRRFARALSTADHRDAAATELRGIGMLARVAHQAARQAVELSGPMLVMKQAGRHDDAPGKNVLAVFKDNPEAAVAGRDPNHRSGVEIGRHLVLKPGSVIDEIFDRQQLGQRQAGFAEIVVEPIAMERVGDMGRNPRRTQLHAARHVASPKRHAFAEHADRDVDGTQMRGRSQAIRTGANNRDVAAIIGTINDDIHANLPQFSRCRFDQKCNGGWF